MQLGRYEVIRTLAQGGMAEIFLAREHGLAGFERVVVVKQIKSRFSTDPSFVDLFLDEARLAAKLSHPNVVHIYDLDIHRGTYYIAMEYVQGCDLARLLRARQGPLPLADALHVATQMLRGLQHAHTLTDLDGLPLEVVHRDVSPKNVLLSLTGLVKIADFGVAKARDKLAVTIPGLIMGTFGYMSPEQAGGSKVDHRADIFAAGAVLYHMVTGQAPYMGPPTQLYVAAQAGAFIHPRKLRPDLPAEVERIILTAMAKDLPDRYESAERMRADVDAVASRYGLQGTSDSVAAVITKLLPDLRDTVRSWLRERTSQQMEAVPATAVQRGHADEAPAQMADNATLMLGGMSEGSDHGRPTVPERRRPEMLERGLPERGLPTGPEPPIKPVEWLADTTDAADSPDKTAEYRPRTETKKGHAPAGDEALLDLANDSPDETAEIPWKLPRSVAIELARLDSPKDEDDPT